jgi:hypothetical protein
VKFGTEREKQLFLSSVLLKKLDSRSLPIGMATGCLVDYENQRLLLTVSHATADNGKWTIELQYDPELKRTMLFTVGAMHFLAKGSLWSPEIEEVDFSYTTVPKDLRAFRQEVLGPNEVKDEMPVTIHQIDFSSGASAAENFGFCGAVLPKLLGSGQEKYLYAQMKVYDGLKYLRSEDDYLIFKLPERHPGHEQFEGCSGAPVLDTLGSVVGLVCSGDEDTNEIWAIAISRFKTPIDLVVGKIR